MKTRLMKLGIITLPIFIMWSSGFVFVTMMHLLDPHSFSLSETPGSMSVSYSNQLPYFGSWIVLGFSIYLSIKLWIKYIKE